MHTDHTERINRVVDHIQSNLGSDLSVSRLARIACYSEFHFSRIFKSVVGEPVHGFIRRLRLEKAAQRLLAAPEIPVTEIALACGFATPSSFAKGFKARFGMNATQWRRHWVQPRERTDFRPGPALDRGRPVWTFGTGEGIRRVGIEDIPSLTVAYIRHVGPFQGDGRLFDRLYARLFRWALPRGYATDGQATLNIYHDNPHITGQNHMRVMVAVPVPDSAVPWDPVGITRLPGGRYGVCRLRLAMDQFVPAWEWLFSAWLPASGFELADRELLERYLGETRINGIRHFDVELCVPVRPA